MYLFINKASGPLVSLQRLGFRETLQPPRCPNLHPLVVSLTTESSARALVDDFLYLWASPPESSIRRNLADPVLRTRLMILSSYVPSLPSRHGPPVIVIFTSWGRNCHLRRRWWNNCVEFCKVDDLSCYLVLEYAESLRHDQGA